MNYSNVFVPAEDVRDRLDRLQELLISLNNIRVECRSLKNLVITQREIKNVKETLDKLLCAYNTYKDNPNGIRLPD